MHNYYQGYYNRKASNQGILSHVDKIAYLEAQRSKILSRKQVEYYKALEKFCIERKLVDNCSWLHGSISSKIHALQTIIVKNVGYQEYVKWVREQEKKENV